MEKKEASHKTELKEGEGVINNLTNIISEKNKVNLSSYMNSTDIFPPSTLFSAQVMKFTPCLAWKLCHRLTEIKVVCASCYHLWLGLDDLDHT